MAKYAHDPVALEELRNQAATNAFRRALLQARDDGAFEDIDLDLAGEDEGGDTGDTGWVPEEEEEEEEELQRQRMAEWLDRQKPHWAEKDWGSAEHAARIREGAERPAERLEEKARPLETKAPEPAPAAILPSKATTPKGGRSFAPKGSGERTLRGKNTWQALIPIEQQIEAARLHRESAAKKALEK